MTIRCPSWRAELITRADAGDESAVRWLVCEIATRGWPVRRLVGWDGAAAALRLAERASLAYRTGWAVKVAGAMDAGGVPRQLARRFVERALSERDGR